MPERLSGPLRGSRPTPNGGLVVTASPFGGHDSDLVAALAAQYKLPAVYPFSYFVRAGGLISYGADLVKQSRPAAVYVDRILKGDKWADLPVQAPTKYELVINLKTAKALGLTVPPMLPPAPDRLSMTNDCPRPSDSL